MRSWFVFRYRRNTGVRASAGSSFPWPAKKPGGWGRTNCTFRLIPQKSRVLHTGRLDAVSQKKSMRNWRQRSRLMSKWNTDYKKQAGFLPDPLFIQEGNLGAELPRQAVTLSREKGRSLRNTKKPPVH